MKKLKIETVLEIMNAEIEQFIMKYRKKVESFYISSILHSAADAERFSYFTYTLKKRYEKINKK